LGREKEGRREGGKEGRREGGKEGRREVMIYSVARTDKSKRRLAEHRIQNAELGNKTP
jgi:hypothetical protein